MIVFSAYFDCDVPIFAQFIEGYEQTKLKLN